jgi:hypothetical protein
MYNCIHTQTHTQVLGLRLCVSCQVTVRLHAVPEATAAAVCTFPSIEGAANLLHCAVLVASAFLMDSTPLH